MRIGVTGASGFIGSVLCRMLSACGYHVERLKPGRQDGKQWDGISAVVHLAAIAHRRASREELERVNVGLAVETARLAAALGAQFLFLSSVKVHGNHATAPLRETSPIAPADPYGESKARAEESLCAIPGLRLAVLRPPLVYGPGVKANFLALMSAVARGWPLPFASIENRRSIAYVGNVATAIVTCLGREGTFLVSDGPPVSIPQMCRAIGAALQRPAKLFPFPPRLLPKKLSCSLEVDDSAIRRELGWLPSSSMKDGLKATADWYLAR